MVNRLTEIGEPPDMDEFGKRIVDVLAAKASVVECPT